MTSTIKEIIWLCWLLAYMRIFLSHSTPMHCDSAIQIAHNNVFHERTKYVGIDCHLTHHHLKHGTITLPFVFFSLQLTDFFIRLHFVFRFHFLVDKFSMLVASIS